MATPDHEVIIIGAGLGGLGAAIKVREAGIDDVVILERADAIGGTWRDNDYPGIAVDVPAQAYQFSFELNPDWKRTYATGDEVRRYIDRLADHHDLRPLIRLGTEVMRREWDEDHHVWRLHLRGGDELTARFVIAAVGAFVDPKPVDIPGVDDYEGKILRSCGWDHDYALAGKRIAVIGTGASAVQIVPELADVVDHLDVYQRTPIWVAPKRDRKVPPRLRSFFRTAPSVQEAVRRFATARMEFLLVGSVVKYQRFPWGPKLTSWLLANVWYRTQVPDPELRRRLVPGYGFGCKRPSVSNTYLSSFTRPHVELVTDPIERFTADGLRTVDGRERPVDAVVLATGFRMATDPAVHRDRPVTGRDGFDLATHYAEHRLASYESVSLPGLPNHFMIFGPYGWTGGTWHQLVEVASEHIVRVITETRRRGATSVEVTQEATDEWTAEMRGRMERSLFQNNGCGSANSYYFDHHGDTPYLRPTSSAAAMEAARTFPFEHYRFDDAACGAAMEGAG